ncbi:MAG TPA: acetyl-coenzyme A synthetase N-terminal domain-containing protein, partial [Alphaproteobacteria bacterium]
MTSRFEAIYRSSLEDPEGFWAAAAEQVDWYRKWDRVLDDSNKPFYRWFEGGVVNSCHNALDRHVASGRGAQPALIYDSPVTGTVASFSYAEMRDWVARAAGMLAAA